MRAGRGEEGASGPAPVFLPGSMDRAEIPLRGPSRSLGVIHRVSPTGISPEAAGTVQQSPKNRGRDRAIRVPVSGSWGSQGGGAVEEGAGARPPSTPSARCGCRPDLQVAGVVPARRPLVGTPRVEADLERTPSSPRRGRVMAPLRLGRRTRPRGLTRGGPAGSDAPPLRRTAGGRRGRVRRVGRRRGAGRAGRAGRASDAPPPGCRRGSG